MYGPEYKNIVEEICINNDIEFKSFDDQCFSLKYKGNTQYIWSRRFPHNSASTARLIDSKCLCSSVLRSYGLPAIIHSKLYRSDTEGYAQQEKTNQQICETILNRFGGVVIKPNDSFEGKNVFACFTSNEIEYALFEVFRKKEILAAAPYVDASAEYRVFYLDGDCLLAYRKRLPYVMGDGISTLAELVSSSDLRDADLQKNLAYSSVPPKGEIIEIGWKYNLSRGSMPEIIDSKATLNPLFQLAKQAAEAVNARFVTVDLLRERQTEELYILEINAGVAMDQFILKHPQGHSIAYSIYEKAIQRLFADN